MTKFKFDETCCGWDTHMECNGLYMEMQRQYLNEKLNQRGYVYLNEVYESFGAKWDPEDDNLCYRIECGSIEMKFIQDENGRYDVIIY